MNCTLPNVLLKTPQMSQNIRTLLKTLFGVLLVFLVCIILAETLLRIFLIQPLGASMLEFKSSPSLFVKRDSILGYCLKDGLYTIQYNNGYSYTATHIEGKRVGGQITKRPISVGVFGCSFAYGQGLNDTQTMSYFLQQSNDSFEVSNYAVPGYGTLHQYLILKQLSKHKRLPKIAILTYGSFHNERNIAARKHIKMMAWGGRKGDEKFTYPSLSLKNDIRNTQINYPLLKLCCKFSLVNTIDDLFNASFYSEKEAFEATCHIIDSCSTLCKENNTSLIVLGLNESTWTSKLQERCYAKGVYFTAPSSMVRDKKIIFLMVILQRYSNESMLTK